MKKYPTSHIDATPDDFAKTVLMPGDPLRSEYIASHFLTDAHLINNVRGIRGYTGFYKGEKISVMASGMGMPSMGIYSYELFNFFGVENIIRIGTAGAMSGKLHLRDVVLAMGASTNSNYASQYNLSGTFSATASYSLLRGAQEIAAERGVQYHVGNVLTSDTFYSDDTDICGKWSKMGILCVEMETAALYMNAARCNKNALAVLTVSDSLVTGEKTTPQERQTSFNEMVSIALETALRGGF